MSHPAGPNPQIPALVAPTRLLGRTRSTTKVVERRDVTREDVPRVVTYGRG
jgi:hypothetical protein